MDKNSSTKYKKVQDLFFRQTFKDKGFTCQHCGMELKTFHSNHLKKCGISKDDYINKFGYPNKYYEKNAILKEVTDKISDLYIINRNKWLILSGITRSYVTKETEKIKEENEHRNKDERQMEMLTTSQVKAHLKGINTLGVFPKWKTSKFFVIDIDSYDGLENAKEVAINIKMFLKQHFPENQIHVNFSGNKGYHVTLYFDRFVEIKSLYRLFIIILNNIKIERFINLRVEMRPTLQGPDGYGVKLPLGANFINKDDYKNYAYFVDDLFRVIENEIEYVLNIEKSSCDIVFDILDAYMDEDLKQYGENVLNIKDESENVLMISDTSKVTVKNVHSKIKRIIEKGLEEHGTRHYWSFLIALYYKESCIEKDKAFDLLFEWSKNQIETGMSMSSLAEVVKDISQIIYKGVYHSEKRYNLPQRSTHYKDVYLCEHDMNKFVQINDYAIKHGKMMIYHQRVFLALLIHAKQYGDCDGKFYMTYEQILLLSHLGSRDTVNKGITDLQQLGFIDIVTRNSKLDKTTGKKEPNVFRISFTDNHCDDDHFRITHDDLQDKECFFRVMYRYYGKDNLDKVFKKSIKYKVLKMNLDHIKI